jgi:hypothetical protein
LRTRDRISFRPVGDLRIAGLESIQVKLHDPSPFFGRKLRSMRARCY